MLVETDEQLIHLVRYIHLNPYSSGVVKSLRDLLSYPWSSLQEYLDPQVTGICDEKEIVLKLFKNNREAFKKFTLDQAEYQKRLDKIKHLIQEYIPRWRSFSKPGLEISRSSMFISN